MVVRIRSGKSIHGALSYNERKAAQDKAIIISASGFPANISEIGFSGKLKRFSSLIERNERVRINTVHLSLNFSPEEFFSKKLTGEERMNPENEERMRVENEKLSIIAKEYMTQIGFGAQPFIVYRHFDSNHPHVHIVTTNIQANGRSISLHNIGRLKSEPARKSLELQFGLVQAEKQRKDLNRVVTADRLLPIKYGKEAVKHAITNIVGEVVRTYKFSSLEEFNVILESMNVRADRGAIGSKMHEAGGLIYSVIIDGNRIGQPIKASSIYEKPTLSFLKMKFAYNLTKKNALKSAAVSAMKSNLLESHGFRDFQRKLWMQGIQIELMENALGIIKSIYFIDKRKKVVFSAQDLGVNLSQIYFLRAMDYSKTKRPSISKKDETKRHIGPHPSRDNLNPVIYQLLKSSETYGSPEMEDNRRKKKKRRPLL